MVTFTLTTPVNVGTLTAPINVSSLQITGMRFTTTPALAPLGAAQLSVTLTDPTSGWQETIDYQDVSVMDFFDQTAPTPDAGETLKDVTANVLFAKLIADDKLPAGTLSS
jgi:hypothetical protein